MQPLTDKFFLSNLTKLTNNINEDSFLLAVSGGVDSMVMAHLFLKNNLKFSIAHINYQLRGEDSNQDEELVSLFCSQNNIPFFVLHPNLKQACLDSGKSIQMMAREIRYNWFQEVAIQNGNNFIATAHHKNDNTETLLLNFIKGSYLEGLRGIPNTRGNIIRPLLSVDKNQIYDYAQKNNIDYREDTSNQKNNYERNILRNKAIPLLSQINPNLHDSLYESAQYRKEIVLFLDSQLDALKKSIIQTNKDFNFISKQDLTKLNPAILSLLLTDYGLTFNDAQSIFNSINTTETKNFFTPNYLFNLDRNSLSFAPSSTPPTPPLLITQFGKYTFNNLSLTFSQTQNYKEFIQQHNCLVIPKSQCSFPITIRYWSEGDKIKPFGLKGTKLVSKIFISKKISTLERTQHPLIIANGKVLWIIGLCKSELTRCTDFDSEFVLITTFS